MLLPSRATVIALAATAIGVAALLGVAQWRLHTAKTEIADLRAELAESRQNAAALASELKIQSAAVQSWKSEADRRVRLAQAALKRAEEYRALAEKRKASLEAYNTSGKEECDAMREIVDIARGLR
jgi:chromosome segregation ATPase